MTDQQYRFRAFQLTGDVLTAVFCLTKEAIASIDKVAGQYEKILCYHHITHDVRHASRIE